MQTLGTLGEHAAIRMLTAKLGEHPLVRTGTGDDCAVTEIPGTGLDQVFTTDPVIERVHFLPSDDPFLVGGKAAGRVLSDLAAMGARPQWLLVNVVAPPEQDVDALSRMYDGLLAICSRFGATLIGGDLAKGATLELHVFGTGTVPEGHALLRSGALAGDCILVTGALGGSIRGKHLDFIPRVKEGLFLRESGVVHAMMDISDGLATDLRHILTQSEVGAVLQVDRIPVATAADSVEQALFDGEDFELLLTVAAADCELLRDQWQRRFGTELFKVGRITDERSVIRLEQSDGSIKVLSEKAFEHFRTEKKEV